MLVQRGLPCLFDRVTELPAAAQHDFPKPDIQIVQMGQNPIRPFAALPFYVSHADEASFWLFPIAYLQRPSCSMDQIHDPFTGAFIRP